MTQNMIDIKGAGDGLFRKEMDLCARHRVLEPVDLPPWAFVPGPLMAERPGMRPEPLMNSGWRLQLVLVPARAPLAANRYSDAMIFSSVRAGSSLAN